MNLDLLKQDATLAAVAKQQNTRHFVWYSHAEKCVVVPQSRLADLLRSISHA